MEITALILILGMILITLILIFVIRKIVFALERLVDWLLKIAFGGAIVAILYVVGAALIP